jgi:hypothetical protein
MFRDPVCSTFRKILLASILGIAVFLIPAGVQSATNKSATLQWAPNQESDLAGYRVSMVARWMLEIRPPTNLWT